VSPHYVNSLRDQTDQSYCLFVAILYLQNIEDIPISALGPDDDDRKHRKHRKHKSRKDEEKSKYEVLSVLSPNLDAEDDEDDQDDDSDEDLARKLKKIGDLTKVKEGTVALPTVKQYPIQSADKAKSSNKVEEKSPTGRDKEGRSSRGKNKEAELEEGKHRRHHRSDKDDKEHRSSSKHSSSRSHSKRDKEKEKETSSSSKKDKPSKDAQSLLLDLDDSAPTTAEPDVDMTPVEERKRSSKTREHRDKSGKEDKQQIAEKEAKDRDDKEKRKHKSHKSSSSAKSSNNNNSNLLSDLYGDSQASPLQPCLTKSVFADDKLSISSKVLETRVDDNGVGVEIFIEFTFLNRSAVHMPSVSATEKLKGNVLDCGIAGLAPAASFTKKLRFEVEGSSRGDAALETLKIPVDVKYTAASSSTVETAGVLVVPSSAFLIARPISLGDYENLMRSSNMLPFTSTCKISLSRASFTDTLAIVSSHLHFHVTANTANAATLYAQSIAELSVGMKTEQVCLMMKVVGDDSLGVSVRSSHKQLAESICTELSEVFGV
jgi:hypothetical protein